MSTQAQKDEDLRNYHGMQARHHNVTCDCLKRDVLAHKDPLFLALLKYHTRMRNKHRSIAESLHRKLQLTPQNEE